MNITSSEKFNSREIAEEYINAVLDGEITACKWLKFFCQRHVKDLTTGAERGLYFDEKAGERILKFFNFLKHSKGAFAGKSFILSPWQCAYLYILFGWKRRENGKRRFRTSYLEIGRKNGKSTIASGVALYLLDADGEQGAEVYTVATKYAQARITFDEASRMVNKSPGLKKKMILRTAGILVPDTNSKLEPLSSDYKSMDGLNISGAIIDELHAHKTRDVFDLIETATGAREQPLLFTITTAGSRRESICYELHDYLTKILEGTIIDDSFCGCIFTLDEGDDYTNEAVWEKANPNLNVSAGIEDLRNKIVKVKETPASLNSFLRLHMNCWVNEADRFIDMDKWLVCNGRSDNEILKAATCFGGLDLSTINDLTALVLKFPLTGDVLCWFWIPEDNMELRERRDKVPFSAWVREGYVEATPGNVIDYDYIKARVRQISEEYKGLKEIGYDPYNATQIAIQLEGEGFRVVPVRQGWVTMSPALKELQREYISGELKHGGNSVLNWMASNLVVKKDSAENFTFDKAHSFDRIDGISALCTALSRQIESVEDDTTSIYENRGLFIL